MSMNLRHKKPINSYRGQANNDKNEFNDDDFKHQPSPAKKFVTTSGEQMYKYSRILVKFIMNANQFYRQKSSCPKKQKSDIQMILEESKLISEESKNLKNPKKSQQLKQKRKIIPKIQNEKLQQKQQKQKQCKKIQIQPKLNKNIKESQPQKNNLKTAPIKNPSVNTQVSNEKTEMPNKQKTQNILPQNLMNMYNPNMPMNPYANMGVYPNMFINNIGWQQQMMRMAMIQQMLKNQQMKGINFNNFNPQFMTGLINNTELMNMKQNYYQNYLRNNIQPQPIPNNLNKQKQTIAPIYDLTQTYLKKKQSLFNENKQKPNQIVKRANFHIGIAYHIYLSELEKKNININTIDMNQIDPTRLSREIKSKQHGGKRNSKTKPKK